MGGLDEEETSLRAETDLILGLDVIINERKCRSYYIRKKSECLINEKKEGKVTKEVEKKNPIWRLEFTSKCDIVSEY